MFQECNGHRVSASVPRVLVGNKCDLVDQIQVSVLKQGPQHSAILYLSSQVELGFTAKPLCFPRCPPTWRWSSPTPTTCCCLRRRPRTRGRVRTSTLSSCRWRAAWRPRNPCSTETWRGRMGGSDSHKRLKQRAVVLVEEKEEWEA